MVYANNERGPGFNEILFIDRASGEILEDHYNSQLKTMWWLGTWNYPLHVGTIWGLPTKIIWLVTCIILTTLARDGRLDVVGASPDGPARPAPPRRRPPPPLASRHRRGDQYFSTRAGPLGGGGFGS